MYTAHFHEYAKLLADVGYSGVTTEQNTSFVDVSNYARVAIIIKAINVTTTLDADIEIDTASTASADLHTLKSITQLTSGDDAAVVCVNVRGEELSKPTGAADDEYRYLRVETTPSGSGTYVVLIFGLEPRYAPVGVTEWDEVVT